ncbi:hypothetical protein [Rhodococcus daqingensis]|uniref:Capsular polysaccharide biosynthesis protein n=1 Tax=Rhodococcus daqingensis TaxID=2479363 RepID=A0ABW2RZ24_9NOCA
MDLFDVARSCLRRWYLLFPLLLLTCWVSLDAYGSVRPVYYANTVLGLAPPSVRVESAGGQSAPGEVRRNALLDVGGATLIANMAALGLREPSVVDRVVAAGGLPDYESKMFPVPAPQQLPLIMIESTSADPTAVSKTLELVSAQAEVTLRTLQQQARVPDDLMVVPFPVSPPSAPGAAMPTRTRSTMSIFLAGLGLSVLFTVVVDVLLTRRKSRGPTIRASAPAADRASPGQSSSHVDEPNEIARVSEDTMDAT